MATIVGTIADDDLIGTEFVDDITGLEGDDLLAGDAGNDTLDGGFGNDLILGEAGADVIYVSMGFDLIDGGADIDRIDFAFALGIDITVSLALAGMQVLVPGLAGIVLIDVENVTAYDGNDRLTGSAAANELFGGAGNDILLGLGGDDRLMGGAGNDTMDGGAGIDTALYLDARPAPGQTGDIGVTLNLALTGPQNTGIAGIDRVLGIENVVGSAFGDRLTGSALANVLTGGGGDDVLNGAAGNDTLLGGAGNDSLQGGAGIDTASYEDLFQFTAPRSLGVTIDLARTDAQDTGGQSGVDTLSGIENVIGTNAIDRLRGDGLANRLEGRQGRDLLAGLGGNDVLQGDEGDDVLEGGAGVDLLLGGAGDDLLVGGIGNDTIDGGEGIDTVAFLDIAVPIRFSLAQLAPQNTGGAGVDRVRGVENVIGGAGADQITGNGGANRLQGLGGNDVLSGGAGNDVLEGGAGNDTMLGGAGIDTADYSSSAAAVRVDLALTRAQATGGGGTDTLREVENLVGTALADILGGNALANRLDGGQGDDQLEGRAGDDILRGGGGNDRLDGGAGIDTVSYRGARNGITIDLARTGPQAADGNDTLISIEGVIGTGRADRLLGSNGDNVLVGGGGNDTIEGRDGDDRIAGGAGDDALDGGAGDDVVSLGLGNDAAQGGLGTDTIDFSDFVPSSFAPTNGINFTLAGSGQQFTVVGSKTVTGFENLIGTAFDDTLNGNFLANRIEGGAGADRILDVAGDDTLLGGAGDDQLSGGEGVDLLDGGAGNDVLDGGIGADRLIGGAGIDTADYSAFSTLLIVDLALTGEQDTGAAGRDTLSSIENLRGGLAADTLSGSAAANRIEGGSGNDVLTGRGGADEFYYRRLSDGSAGFGSTIERITDFTRTGPDRDRIAIEAEDLFLFNQDVTSVGIGAVRSIATADTISNLVAGITGVAASSANRIEAALVTVASGTLQGSYVFLNDTSSNASQFGDLLVQISTGVLAANLTQDDFLLA